MTAEPFDLMALPQELIDMVVRQVDFVTLKQCRLACRALYQQATPLVFQRVEIDFYLESLQDLVDISLSPVLYQHVTEVSCYITGLFCKAYPDFRKALEMDGPYFDSDWEDDMDEPRPLKKSYERYKNACGERQENLKTDLDPELLKDASSMLPALKKVDFSNDLDPDRGLYVLGQVLNDLQHSHCNLDTLHLKTEIESLICAHGIMLPMEKHALPGQSSTINNLKTLRVNLPCIMVKESAHDRHLELSTVIILEEAVNLQDLYLELSEANSEYDEGNVVRLEELLGSKKIGRLQNLRISGLIDSDLSFTQFFKTSCSELKNLAITKVRLLAGTWTSIFEAIHQEPHRLESVELRDFRFKRADSTFKTMQELPESNLLQDYLMKRTNQNSWVESAWRL